MWKITQPILVAIAAVIFILNILLPAFYQRLRFFWMFRKNVSIDVPEKKSGIDPALETLESEFDGVEKKYTEVKDKVDELTGRAVNLKNKMNTINNQQPKPNTP